MKFSLADGHIKFHFKSPYFIVLFQIMLAAFGYSSDDTPSYGGRNALAKNSDHG